MEDKVAQCKNLLIKYKQEHLLGFFDELEEEKKEKLLNQILSINFEKILKLYDNSFVENNNKFIISPAEYIEKDRINEKEKYVNIGKEIILKNEFAICTMAGGQGTRLGYKGPKGTFKLDIVPKKSLFEILIDNLKYVLQQYGVALNWYIMTSYENDIETKKFFETNNFFGYPKEKITFFVQDKLPIIDINKKLILKETYEIKEGSNGNGDFFNALKKNNIIDDMKKKNIKWMFIGGIDNVLSIPTDELFLGLCAYKKYNIASKSIFKKTDTDTTAVFCKKNDKIALLYPQYINKELTNLKDENDRYLYRDINIVSHIMNIDTIEKMVDKEFPYNRAFKKSTFINYEGMKEVPEKPNSYKFEKFIFSAFSYFDKMLILRVNEDEFAPIKDYTGIYSPETAKEKYLKYKMSGKRY